MIMLVNVSLFFQDRYFSSPTGLTTFPTST